jgi:hypothetical protein
MEGRNFTFIEGLWNSRTGNLLFSLELDYPAADGVAKIYGKIGLGQGARLV